jgi:MYXO-CTERM domain-containing protein
VPPTDTPEPPTETPYVPPPTTYPLLRAPTAGQSAQGEGAPWLMGAIGLALVAFVRRLAVWSRRP